MLSLRLFLRGIHIILSTLFRPTRPPADLFDPVMAATVCLFPSRPAKELIRHARCFVLNCLPICRPSMLSSSVQKQPIRGRSFLENAVGMKADRVNPAHEPGVAFSVSLKVRRGGGGGRGGERLRSSAFERDYAQK